MLPKHLQANLMESFVHQFRDQMNAHGDGVHIDRGDEAQDNLSALKRKTATTFGFEWEEYNRFGWDDPVHNMQQEQMVFRMKSLLEDTALRNSLVLDAGCGNGRYSYLAAKCRARVVGVDMSTAVDVAFENTLHLPEVQIVQGDLFQLPFIERAFDAIFSIGVLMHTGNPLGALKSLSRHLKTSGILSIHVYGKGNFIYEWVDQASRQRTTRMSISELQAFTKLLYRIARILSVVRLRPLVAVVFQLEAHPHFIFDWYSAPLATHHTYHEVESWFRELGLMEIRTDEKDPMAISPTPWKRPLLRLLKAPRGVTIRGSRKEP
jgi:SAM-dependent methyltransferase